MIEEVLREDTIHEKGDMLEKDLRQEVMYPVMICMIQDNVVMDTEHENMIHMIRELVIEKQQVLVVWLKKQEQVMIKVVLVEGIELSRMTIMQGIRNLKCYIETSV